MSKIDEAIVFCQHQIQQLKSDAACLPSMLTPNIQKATTRYEAMLCVLMEKQEREKGCDVCHTDNRQYHFRGNPPNFCPHCGKSLKEISNETQDY